MFKPNSCASFIKHYDTICCVFCKWIKSALLSWISETLQVWPDTWFQADDTEFTEPGIHRGNEDSRGTENKKWQKKIFSVKEKSTSILLFYEN